MKKFEAGDHTPPLLLQSPKNLTTFLPVPIQQRPKDEADGSLLTTTVFFVNTQSNAANINIMEDLIKHVDEDSNILEDDDEDNETSSFTLKELIEITKTTLNEVIQKDSLLSDLPLDVTAEEVNEQIALEHGQSMTVYVTRADGEELPVVVKHKQSTVLDLKRAIRRHMAWRMTRQKQRVKVSWRYIWKTYHLQYESERLTKDEMLLSEIGIKNRSRVTFIKRLREKGIGEKG